MKSWKCLFISMIIIISCSEPEPRKPIQARSGSFFKESVQRSKKILEAETAIIEKQIANDSLSEYLSSKSGFWYTYETKIDSSGYLPQSNDVVFLTYNIMTLNGDTIYRAPEIGLVEYAVDKTKLFAGLRNGLKLLQQKEKATFIFPSGQAYGYKGDTNKIGPNTPIKSSITILKIKKDSSNLN